MSEKQQSTGTNEERRVKDTRCTGMHREGDIAIHRFTDGTRLDIRVEWTPEDAVGLLVEDWLDPVPYRKGDDHAEEIVEAQPEHLRTAQQARFIREDGKTLGVLISAEEYEEGRAAIHRINQDAYGERDTGYQPFRHAPNPTTDRIINTEVLERIIRDAVHGKGAEVTREERDKIHYLALVAALEFTFDPDSRGLVPVMTPGRAMDSQVTEYYWSFLYPTPVAGLYLRAEDDIIGVTSYTVTTATGYAIVGGFYERDYADELAVKVAEAMPGLSWFTVRQGDLTTELKETAREVIREHGRWRKDLS